SQHRRAEALRINRVSSRRPGRLDGTCSAPVRGGGYTMDYKAVFFDFDYTLGDATEAIVAGFQYAFAKMGLPEPEREAVRRTIGMMLEDEYTVLTGDGGPENRARFRKLYTEKAGPLQVESTRLFPGAAELLTALHRQGIPAGIVSTKKTGTLRDVLEARGVAHLLT